MLLREAISYAKTVILDILDCIQKKETDNDILESYEFLSKHILGIIKEKDTLEVNLFFKALKVKLEEALQENKKINYDDINKVLFKFFKETDDRKYLNCICDLICEDTTEFSLEKKKKVIESDSESSSDKSDGESDESENEEINVPLEEVIEEIKWRDNQKKAIKNTIEQGFKSGVHDQIMGAGKTYIILNLIWKHYQENKNNNIYPIVCYRQEILKDLFFDKYNEIDKKKVKLWKDNDIIDLDKFNIIDRINNKKKNLNIDTKKPNILVINTGFLESIEKANTKLKEEGKEKVLDYKKINFAILDECHGVSADILHRILRKIKYSYKKSIIGFSATVLRDGAEDKIVDIFSKTNDKEEKDKKLNIISRYDFMNAIRDNIILPPYYTIMEVKKTVKNKIGQQNKDTIKKVLLDTFENLPYKKIICWCRTIQQMKDYYKYFVKTFGKEYTIYCSSSRDSSMSDEFNIDNKEFFESNGKSIMICVNRFREGSDIKHLDMGVYLDRVKKRTTLVAMQTSGRVLRVDPEKKKTHGYILDSFINDDTEKIEMLTANIILSYYNKILALSEDNVETRKHIEDYHKLIDKIENQTKFNKDTQEITVKIDDGGKKDMKIKLELITKSIDWQFLKKILINNVEKAYSIKHEDSLKSEYELLKKKIRKINSDECKINNKTEYKEYAEDNDLEVCPEIKYKDHGWKNYYDFLGIDTSDYPCDLISFKKKLDKCNIRTEKTYYRVCNKYGLPSMPFELYSNLKTIDAFVE